MKPLIGVLALQGDILEHAAKLEQAGAATRPVRRETDLEGLAGLVIPGGESTTMMKLLDVFGLGKPLARELAAGLPVWGTCAGMILLAREILDGRSDQKAGFACIDMQVRRNAFGSQVDSYEEDLLASRLSQPERPFRAVFIRAPWVETAGEGVEILATSQRTATRASQHTAMHTAQHTSAGAEQPSSAGTANSASTQVGGINPIVAVAQEQALAISFHPELGDDLRWQELFLTDFVKGA